MATADPSQQLPPQSHHPIYDRHSQTISPSDGVLIQTQRQSPPPEFVLVQTQPNEVVLVQTGQRSPRSTPPPHDIVVVQTQGVQQQPNLVTLSRSGPFNANAGAVVRVQHHSFLNLIPSFASQIFSKFKSRQPPRRIPTATKPIQLHIGSSERSLPPPPRSPPRPPPRSPLRSPPPSPPPSAGPPVLPEVINGVPLTPNRLRRELSRRPRILFYHSHQPYYGFTNFSAHPVTYKQKKYPTSEHLFQSFKFTHRPGLAEHIRTCSTRPSVAFSEARRFAPEVREDWIQDNIHVMDIVLYHKFTQHKDLKRDLLETGNAELIENSDKDAFWGCGADGRGRNELGKALERLRTQLREAEPRRKPAKKPPSKY